MKAILMVNSKCNANCRHCYIPYKGSRSPENTLETVIKLQEKGHDVVIAGTETLMDTDYLKAYQQAGQDYILTNGILLHNDKSLYGLLRIHGIRLIVLSMHSGDELKTVPEKLVAEVIREAKRRDFLVRINSTVTSRNYKDIRKMCLKALEYGADKIQFGRFVAIGKGRGMLDLRLSDEEVADVFEQVSEVRRRFSKDELEIRLAGYFGPRPGSKGEVMAEGNNYCPAGVDLVAIDPEDNVYGCPFIMGRDNIIGRYVDGDIIIERDLFGGRRDCCLAHLVGG